MTRFIKKSITEIGDSPYEVKFRGSKKADEVLLRVIDFDSEQLIEEQLGAIREIERFRSTETVTWLNIDGLHDIPLMEEVCHIYGLDRIIASEALNTDQRPKIQDYDNCLFISIKMMRYDDASKEILIENLSLVMLEDELISLQEIKGDVFEPIRDRLRKGKKKIRTSGTDYLGFALLDIVIDHYLYILSELGEKIETLEDLVLRETSNKLLEEIGDLKREISFMRRNIIPAREMLHNLSKLDSDLIDKTATNIHWQELQGNISLALETADGYRDMLSDMMNMYHTNVSSKLNDVMKFLTIFSVIFIPLTFIAGIYGTNFEFVPELHYRYSYFIMWGVMLIIAISMIFYFRKKDWF
ncbi:magnesium/cobalt transporter CorA [bacterium]|nr:magnesium/cobalt transporter CorA [bacterium]